MRHQGGLRHAARLCEGSECPGALDPVTYAQSDGSTATVWSERLKTTDAEVVHVATVVRGGQTYVSEPYVSYYDQNGRQNIAPALPNDVLDQGGVAARRTGNGDDGIVGITTYVYLMLENRSYDQVLGDIQEGNGDERLCIFGEKVTPNQHKLARE